MDSLPSPQSSQLTEGPPSVRAMPGHVVVGSVQDLTEDRKRNLEDILVKAKSMNSQLDECRPTAMEKAKFFSDIFRYWKSGQRHQLPDHMSLTSGMKDKTVEVAVLLEDCPSEKEVRDEQKRRGHSTKLRAYKHLVRDLGVKTSVRERMRGAAVWMRSKITIDNQVNIQLLTSNGHFLSPGIKKAWLDDLNETTAHYEVFKAHDMFELNRVNRYNLQVAVFIARNRVTHWANGHSVDSRPHDEPFRLLVPTKTIRHSIKNAKIANKQTALDMLDDLEPYTLYESIPAEEAEEDEAKPDDRVLDA